MMRSIKYIDINSCVSLEIKDQSYYKLSVTQHYIRQIIYEVKNTLCKIIRIISIFFNL